jgi:formyltetrahydrofolate-dependent phosphoribosylglycinamide formyltransferase
LSSNLARLIILISGSGTNLQAILDAVAAQNVQAQIALVVSNRKAAYGLVRAEQADVPTLYFPLKPYLERGASRVDYDLDLAEQIKVYQPDLIVLAGWMHVLSAEFLSAMPCPVINLHPALPGTFPGIDAIERSFEAFGRGEVTTGGCMVHYVVPEVDAGAVIVQADVPIEADDDLAAFEARMHVTEHRLIVEAIRAVLGQRVP